MHHTTPALPRSLELNLARVADALGITTETLTHVVQNIPYIWDTLSADAARFSSLPVTLALYPTHTIRRVTPQIDAPASFGVPHQGLPVCMQVPTGLGISTVEDAYMLMQENGLLTHGVSLADLQFYVTSPELLPSSWKQQVYAIKSAIVTNTDQWQIPYLECRTGTPYLAWTDFKEAWRPEEMLVSVYPTSIRRIQNRLETMGFRFLSA